MLRSHESWSLTVGGIDYYYKLGVFKHLSGVTGLPVAGKSSWVSLWTLTNLIFRSRTTILFGALY